MSSSHIGIENMFLKTKYTIRFKKIPDIYMGVVDRPLCGL